MIIPDEEFVLLSDAVVKYVCPMCRSGQSVVNGEHPQGQNCYSDKLRGILQGYEQAWKQQVTGENATG